MNKRLATGVSNDGTRVFPPSPPPPLSLFPPGRGVRGAWAGFPPGAWGLGRVPPRGLAPSARAHGTHNTHQEPGTHPQLRLIRLIRLIRFLCDDANAETCIHTFISFRFQSSHSRSCNTQHFYGTTSVPICLHQYVTSANMSAPICLHQYVCQYVTSANTHHAVPTPSTSMRHRAVPTPPTSDTTPSSDTTTPPTSDTTPSTSIRCSVVCV